MRLRDFIFDQEAGVYVPQSGTPAAFDYTDGFEVEKRLLKTIQASSDVSSTSKELENGIIDWPSRYHLSSERANLFRALDMLTKEADVLELGAGCGAITRYLGEQFTRVDAIEGNSFRARIARERCRGLTNVAVYAAPFSEISFRPKYDLVTLIGVLEYAPLFGKASQQNPLKACLSVLRLAKSGLRQNGILILAIENALGLKYWSGCGEDHTGRLFDGVYGYPNQNSPITFNRKELHHLLRQAGFDYIAFYYPFPDYKLPKTIIRESHISPDSLFLHNWVLSTFEDYSGKRDYYLQENLALRSLCRAGLFYDFANSFLVLTSKLRKAKIASSWIARKFATERALPYQQVTSLYADPKPRIEKLRTFHMPSPRSLLRLRAATPRWVPGDLEVFSLYEAMFHDDVYQALLHMLKRYHTGLINSFPTFATDSEGYPLLTGNAFDFTFWNIIWNDRKQQYDYIDDEWEWESSLPVDYMLFRSLYCLFWTQRAYLSAKFPNRDLESLIIDLIKELYPQYDSKRHSENRSREEKALVAVTQSNVALPSLSAPLAERTNVIEMREQLQSVHEELQNIRSSFGYNAMRFFASKIDRLCPEGTRRGEFRKLIVASVRKSFGQRMR
jgi:hypothetical protein